MPYRRSASEEGRRGRAGFDHDRAEPDGACCRADSRVYGVASRDVGTLAATDSPTLRGQKVSASSIGRNAAMRTAQIRVEAAPAGDEPAGNVKVLAKAADDTSQTSLGKVANYIPSEAVTLYIGALAVMASVPASPEKTQALVWSAWAVGIINALLILLSFMEATNSTERTKAFKSAFSSGRFWLAFLLGTVALAVYMVVLPGNPFIPDGWWSALIVLFAGVAIPLVASLVGVVPVPKPEGSVESDSADDAAKKAAAAQKEAADAAAAATAAAAAGTLTTPVPPAAVVVAPGG